MTFYRQKLLDAVRGLIGDNDLNLRLTYAAGHLIQIDDDDVPTKEANRLVGDERGFLVIDDTALPKKGQHSVGVAPQYASALGKTSNCQSLVSVTLASREVPVMVGLRLFLPETWTTTPSG